MATQIYEFYFCGAVTFLDKEKNVKTKIITTKLKM